MKSTALILTLALATLLAVGCSTVNTTERAETVGQANVIRDRRVITDSALHDYARVVQVNTSDLPGDILKVQVLLQNDTSFEQRIIYKFEWYDLTGMLVDTPLSTWRNLTLQGKESRNIVGVAPTPQAKDFKLKLQESERN
ncbi:MAG: YcfL family protein [Phycisphaeraceae bacterium]